MEGQGTGIALAKTKKARFGARGRRRVKTGCRTCKIRHKKCDEAQPACSQCVTTQRICDFLTSSTQISSLIKAMPGPFLDSEAMHFDYFREVGAKCFTLYFEVPIWEGLVLQAACTEPCIRHAALAIGARSRGHYRPEDISNQDKSTIEEFAITQYNLAIRELNKTLDTSSKSKELAVLASIIFIALEILQGHENSVQMHLRNAHAILSTHPKIITTSTASRSPNSQSVLVARAEHPNNPRRTSSVDLGYLTDALSRLDQQMTMFMSFKH